MLVAKGEEAPGALVPHAMMHVSMAMGPQHAGKVLVRLAHGLAMISMSPEPHAPCYSGLRNSVDAYTACATIPRLIESLQNLVRQ